MTRVLDATLDRQRDLEMEIVGSGNNPNPIVDHLEEALEVVMSSFQRLPKWVRIVRHLGTRNVSHIALCATMDKVSKSGNTAQAHPVVNEISQRLLWLCSDMSRDDRLALAWNVLHACRQAGLISLWTNKREDATVVRLTSYLTGMLDEYDLWGLVGMNRRPMIVPPVPHTIEEPGGYLTDALRHGISHGTWQNVVGQKIVAAMNALQNTAWVVDEWTLEVAKYTLLPYESEVNKYSHSVCLQVASEMLGIPFWLVVYLDNRGRLYYLSDVLSPQGNDLCQGVLRFHEKQQLSTMRDWFWARVQVANACSGLPIAEGKKLDKMRFEDRAQWTEDNEKQLVAISKDPLKHLDAWWDGFGKGAGTFRCFAACNSLSEALEDGTWNLPVRLDATSSNNQHSNAALLDADGAWRVNLVPNDTGLPHNFREDICEENRRAWSAGEDDHDYVDMFIAEDDVVNNASVAKDPVMIIPYGGTVLRIGKNFMGDKTWHNAGTEDEPEWMVVAAPDSPIGKLDIDVELQFDVAMKLASRYRKSLLTVVPSILNYMDFIKACVKAAAEDGEPMVWTTAAGLRVENFKNNRVECTLTASKRFDDDSCSSLKFFKFDDELNVRKSCTAGPPNFTHSMDGCHLQLCIWKAITGHGVISIAGIHDCLAMLPKDVPAVRGVIPAMFVALYRESPLVALAETYDVELPEFGDLCIDDVLESEFMFM